MPPITAPDACVAQLSAQDDQRYVLSVVAKRTYRIDDAGVAVVAEEQLPLTRDLVTSEQDPNLLLHDADLIPLKPRTDVIVHGHAYARGAAQSLVASVRIGAHVKSIMVVGNRRCALDATKKVIISPPEPFDRMPLSFVHAYGGRDHATEARQGNPHAPLAPYLVGTHLRAENQSPYLYPRNPCGKGYVVEATKNALERCALPNLEDPRDPLTPERLVVGSPERWIYMPIPQAFGWVHWGWFPRAAFGGIRQIHERVDAPIPEVVRGDMPQEVLDAPHPMALAYEHLLRVQNGAPLDLQLPSLSGKEIITLTHVHPTKPEWSIHLPGRPRRICTDGREGRLNETTPVLQSILIEPDRSLLSVVWRGSAPARRPYYPEELTRMPLLVEW
ncbi:DUF2169 family type VI secretion system accessory protein [Chondromyces crocatus]|uniref:DUF2169 domain-containing protein n=1 Tax=Chondromyces crocatus TaxID=52 RepID=A0A0K1EAT4_CHOCO|nr:DUF2169 domain-containing protein [Chondromyces crocatus]AKT37996.1 uncharacterized protein CMC5_021370 [Chondromyces crocatus]